MTRIKSEMTVSQLTSCINGDGLNKTVTLLRIQLNWDVFCEQKRV